MEDILGVIVYLLIFFLLMLIQFAARKKRTAPVPRNQQNIQQKPEILNEKSVEIFEDWFEEESGDSVIDEESQILARLQQNAVTKEQQVREKEKISYEADSRKKVHEVSQEETSDDTELDIMLNPDELKKAIIYAEILNRKYV